MAVLSFFLEISKASLEALSGPMKVPRKVGTSFRKEYMSGALMVFTLHVLSSLV